METNKALQSVLDNYIIEYKKYYRGEIPNNKTKNLISSKLLKEEIPNRISSTLNLSRIKYKIKGSIGAGNLADIPWMCVFDQKITSTATNGYYIVFLFNAKMKGVYLSLNQGYTEYKEAYGAKIGKQKMNEIAHLASKKIGVDFLYGFNCNKISLDANTDLGKGYENGNIISKYYENGKIPNEQIIIEDLNYLIEKYNSLYENVGNCLINIYDTIDEDLFQVEIQKIQKQIIPEGPIPRKNKTNTAISSKWTRSPGMSATALNNSNYNCEINSSHVTFPSSSGEQFMEAHHLIPMEYQENFIVSIDVPENIVSLCPNCHRGFHNSNNDYKMGLIYAMFEKRQNELNFRGINIDYEELLSLYKIKL